MTMFLLIATVLLASINGINQQRRIKKLEADSNRLLAVVSNLQAALTTTQSAVAVLASKPHNNQIHPEGN